MTWNLAIAGIIEVTYAIFTRTWLRTYATGVELELLKSLLRLGSALAYWWLFRDLILSRRPRREQLVHPLFSIGILVVLLVPVLVGKVEAPNMTTRVVFALTSVVVAVREEFFYRGVLQNVLARSFSLPMALITSNVVFTLYHYGPHPFLLYRILEYFSMGCVMGLIYFGSGSMLAAIVVHATYDAAWTFSPYFSKPLPDPWSTLFYAAGMAIFVLWASTSSNKPLQPAAEERGG
jgi:membrane protease YdiL (CAAX protease family)